jgi:hypothetical protein
MGGSGAPDWSRNADAVIGSTLFHRHESIENLPPEPEPAGPTQNDKPRLRPDFSSTSPLPMEVTIPVLVGVLAAIIFLAVAAAFLRAHKTASHPTSYTVAKKVTFLQFGNILDRDASRRYNDMRVFPSCSPLEG